MLSHTPPHTCPQASPTEGGHCTLGQGHARVTPQDTAWEEALAGHGSPEDTLRTPRRLGASERGDISTEGCSLRGHRPPSHRLPDREPCRLLSKRHPTPRPVPQMLADAGRAQPPGRHLPPRRRKVSSQLCYRHHPKGHQTAQKDDPFLLLGRKGSTHSSAQRQKWNPKPRPCPEARAESPSLGRRPGLPSVPWAPGPVLAGPSLGQDAQGSSESHGMSKGDWLTSRKKHILGLR